MMRYPFLNDSPRFLSIPLLIAFLTLSLSMGLANGFSNAFAELFAGITAINIQMDSQSKIQVHFTADLPFQYEYKIIDSNHFSLRLINAKISDELKNSDNTLKFDLGHSAIQKITLQNNPITHDEELIIEGRQLGEKLLAVTGAEAIRNTSPRPKAIAAKTEKSKPKITTSTRNTLKVEQKKSPILPVITSHSASTRSKTVVSSVPMISSRRSSNSSSKPNLHETSRPSLSRSSGRSSEEAFLALLATDETPQFVPRLSTTKISRIPKHPQPQENESKFKKIETTFTPEKSDLPEDSGISFGKSTVTREAPKSPKQEAQKIRRAPRQTIQAPPKKWATPAYSSNANQPKIIDVPHFGQGQTPRNALPYQHYGPQFRTEVPNGHAPSRFYAPAQATGTPQKGYVDYSKSSPVQQQPQARNLRPSRPIKALPRYYGGAPPISYTISGSEKRYTLPEGSLSEEEINALSFDPETAAESAEAHMYQALSHFRRRNYKRALELVEQAVEMAPENPNVMAALGEIQLKLENHKAAIKAYESAIKHAEKPKLKQKYLKRYIVSLYLQGKRPQAIKKIARLIQNEAALLESEYLPYYILGTLHQETNNTPKAIIALKKAAALNPASPDVQFNLGLAFEFSGQLESARIHYQKALALNPQAEDIAMALRRVRGS